MSKNKFDFGGWATKNDLLCADGRTIRRDAFKDDDGRTVPLVYQHNHEDPTRVIGHALLENRNEGVYAYCSLNGTDIGRHVKECIRHGDINGLSIFANKLTQRGGDVIHGTIRELSVVLAGANPGAVIEFPILEHGEESETEAYIWPGDEDGLEMGDGMSLKHSAKDEEDEDEEEANAKKESKKNEKVVEEEPEGEDKDETDGEGNENDEGDEEKNKKNSVIQHADDSEDDANETVQDVLDSMNDEQRQVVEYLVGQALEGEDAEEGNETEEEKPVSHADSGERTVQDVLDSMSEKQRKVTEFLVAQALASKEDNDDGEDEEDDEASHSYEEGEDYTMNRNIFDNSATEIQNDTLTHDQLATIQRDAMKSTLKEAILQHSQEYGIEQIDYLQPEYREVSGNGAPQFIKRDTTWVSKIMRGVHHTPFAKVKMTFADITGAQARARGYLKSHKKKEEVLALLKREVGPDMVYKKQKLDRQDMIDISEGFDKVAWLKSEMRMMLDEELARAFIVGDGRSPESEDKIKEDKIIPVFKDDPLYVIRKTLEVPEGTPRGEALVDTVTYAWEDYQGTGDCVALMTRREYSGLKLLKDRQGRRIYANDSEIASALGVKEILFVPQMSESSTVRVDETTDKTYKPLVIILDLNDYNVGADKGGSINMFEDFDIDYNQQKYLIETYCSGALTKPYSAIVIEEEVETEEDDDDGE